MLPHWMNSVKILAEKSAVFTANASESGQQTFCGSPPSGWWWCSSAVGFHNFNLRIFNLRVSNPHKLIVDVFLTRCRISMCQGLGPKKHDEISEIDRDVRAGVHPVRWLTTGPTGPSVRAQRTSGTVVVLVLLSI